MTTTTEAPTIDIRDLAAYPRPVARVIAEAVNKHGVGYRLMDGGHIRLFNGDRGVTPRKVSAHSKEQVSLRRLLTWLETNVATWPKDEVTPLAVETLAEVINTSPKPARTRGTPVTATTETTEEWTPVKYGFEQNGDTFRCTTCGYERTGNNRGLHLHAAKHDDSGSQSENGKKGGEARALRAQQRKVHRQEAVRILAEQNGLKVVEKDVDLKAVAKSEKEMARLQAQVEKLTTERDELRARLDLMKEALRA